MALDSLLVHATAERRLADTLEDAKAAFRAAWEARNSGS
jgi:hypothetical protein